MQVDFLRHTESSQEDACTLILVSTAMMESATTQRIARKALIALIVATVAYNQTQACHLLLLVVHPIGKLRR
jgi:hypothetical protein